MLISVSVILRTNPPWPRGNMEYLIATIYLIQVSPGTHLTTSPKGREDSWVTRVTPRLPEPVFVWILSLRHIPSHPELRMHGLCLFFFFFTGLSSDNSHLTSYDCPSASLKFSLDWSSVLWDALHSIVNCQQSTASSIFFFIKVTWDQVKLSINYWNGTVNETDKIKKSVHVQFTILRLRRRDGTWRHTFKPGLGES